MVTINENFLNLQASYLFSTVAKKTAEFQAKNPDAKIIKLGIGDVTRPLAPCVVEAMINAAKEMGNKETFHGYGPDKGYSFLIDRIIEEDYKKRGVNIDKEEVFLSDGAKCDTGHIVDLFGENNKVAITDPVYPVYLDTNVMSGRSGKFNKETGMYDNIVYMPVTAENNFIPELPKEKVDMIYLCFPNNPTGTVLTKQELEKWVKYAKENHSIILYDAAYEAFIEEKDVPHSIYEIPGSKEVAIEFKSFSKTAGFTGVRCAYTIVPKELKAYTKNGEEISVNSLWERNQATKFNGVSYIVQKAAAAIYTEEGKKQIQGNIKYYKENAKIIKEGLEQAGYTVYGGVNSPYVWLKTPANLTSWQFFDILLQTTHTVGTPGQGFGPSGEGYFRLTGFGTRENTKTAIDRIKENLQNK